MIRQRSRRRQRRGEPHTEHGLGVLLPELEQLGLGGVNPRFNPEFRLIILQIDRSHCEK